MKRYTFWFYGSMMTFDAKTPADAMAQANDHFDPLAKDSAPRGAWNHRGCDAGMTPDVYREFIWY